MKTTTLQNKLGRVQEVKLGLSGITLLLGLIIPISAPIPDLIKGNFKSAILAYFAMIVLGIIFITLDVSTAFCGVSFLTIIVVYSLLRNKHLLQYYLDNGYWFIDGTKGEVDAALGYVTSESVWK